MPKFVMLVGDKEVDMTKDVKAAKGDQDINKALVKALKGAAVASWLTKTGKKKEKSNA